MNYEQIVDLKAKILWKTFNWKRNTKIVFVELNYRAYYNWKKKYFPTLYAEKKKVANIYTSKFQRLCFIPTDSNGS